jgi:dTDP-4-amino-4,6-dideoxygalactose transaminase
MTIRSLDLGAATAELRPQIEAAIARVLDSGQYIGGPELERFEDLFATYVEARHCVGVSNGLDALELTLRALGIGPGDEVIVASNTFVATWLAVSAVGATPVAVEPDLATHNLEPARVEAAITPATRLLLPTHLYGQPADLDPLLDVARRHGLLLVEDAAQAHGARYRSRRVGAHGDAVCWSFYPGKNLGALGDAGAVTTDDPALADAIRRLGNYGSSQKYIHDEQGRNARLDPVQAAVLSVKLAHLDEWNRRRAAIAALYLEQLAGLGLALPSVPDWANPAWHLFVVRSIQRDRLQAALAEAGVQTLIHYPVPPHLQRAYAHAGYPAGSLPVAERLAGEVLSLPIGPHLSLGDAEKVAHAVRMAVR